MKFLNRISPKTAKVLREIRDGSFTLQELKDKHGVSDVALSRWLRNRFAWVNFKHAVRQADQRGWLEIKMAAKVATAKLCDSMQTGRRMPLWEMMLCRTLIEVGFLLGRSHGRRPPSNRRKRTPLGAEQDLCHPSMKDREKELMAILEQGQENMPE